MRTLLKYAPYSVVQTFSLLFLIAHFVRVRFGLDSARQKEEEQVAERRPENHGRDRESEEADGQTIAGPTGARGSDGVRASGMVHRSTSTCAGNTNPTANSAQSPAPVQRFDGASDGGVLPPNGAVRDEGDRRSGVAGGEQVEAEADAGVGVGYSTSLCPRGGPCHQLLLVAAGFDSPVGVPWTTTSTQRPKVRGSHDTLLLALLCPCAHPLACSLTSYLPSPRSVDARGVRPHGWVERPWQ